MTSMESLNFDHLIGREVGTATLMKELGRGGMAVIFIAYQRTLKRQIAVKVLPKSLLTPGAAERFQQEAESAAILSHPNIVPIYEVGDTEDFLFFTMQLVQGRPLSQYLERVRRHVLPSKRILPLRATIKITTGVLDALEYAHRQDIIHRDIKPANVLIEIHTSRPIITDFGIAKLLRGPDLKSPAIVGTPIYMAPEQILGKEVDRRADVYATGVMLFEMLVANLPFPEFDTTKDLLKMKLGLKDKVFQKRPSEINPVVDPEMDEIVLRAISHDPGKRYATCREFSERLEAYLNHYLTKRTLGGRNAQG
jgi:serine/threonine-protein kinase